MTTKSTTDQPRTLQEAHDSLRRTRPSGVPTGNEWLAYYRRAERLYQAAADADSDHHYEALTFASAAREDAEALAAEIASAKAG